VLVAFCWAICVAVSCAPAGSTALNDAATLAKPSPRAIWCCTPSRATVLAWARMAALRFAETTSIAGSLAPDGGTKWIANAAAVPFQLTQDQRDVIAAIAGAPFAPPVDLDALPLFRLAPTRYTLQQHVGWQPAKLPSDAVYMHQLRRSELRPDAGRIRVPDLTGRAHFPRCELPQRGSA
jgi:hypothetical protein